ncbi:NmrA family NAD(P)-binding protein [Chondromyces apiculatus]|uniref:NmrA-like domain-containing protein n=1 Tax=Chondromyces apiculatus DSM 436 TaxID=1192034 RepID=A0A017T4C4_9BACT|nr:NmrA family NAD(P)-binding protein [Chondromyces apiculatus]EYF03431.1 Hypothetical protein CAP_5537 [Chondromyces apiculatus DSM 436]
MGDLSDKTVAVLGATGAQGSAVVDALLPRGATVRALVRDEASEGARRLAARGVRLVRGALDDAAALEALFEGADGAFTVLLPGNAEDPGREMRWGATVMGAAERAGVGHVVHSSVSATGWRERLPQQAGTFAKAAGYWDGKEWVEGRLRASTIAVGTTLKPAYFMENFLPPRVSGWRPPGSRPGRRGTSEAEGEGSGR